MNADECQETEEIRFPTYGATRRTRTADKPRCVQMNTDDVASHTSFLCRPMNAAYRTNAYDPAKERAWHLSVWMSPGWNAWCVHDKATGACVALQADKGDALPTEALLPKRPLSVSFTALPEISTLVPESALVPGSEMRFLKMVHGALPTGLLRDEPIGALGARCVYLHDEQAEHRLMMKYPNARSIPRRGSPCRRHRA